MIDINSGQGIHNAGGTTYGLTTHSFGEWCFDPAQQALYQLGGSINTN
jgi:hypothetical protein